MGKKNGEVTQDPAGRAACKGHISVYCDMPGLAPWLHLFTGHWSGAGTSAVAAGTTPTDSIFAGMKAPLFHPGQEVVCTNDDFTLLLVQNPNIQTPRRGPIYTVRNVYDTHNGFGITLVQINNAAVAPGFPEANFHESRFSLLPPVEEVDISAAIEETVAV